MSPASQNLNDLEGAANAHTNVREVFAHSWDVDLVSKHCVLDDQVTSGAAHVDSHAHDFGAAGEWAQAIPDPLGGVSNPICDLREEERRHFPLQPRKSVTSRAARCPGFQLSSRADAFCSHHGAVPGVSRRTTDVGLATFARRGQTSALARRRARAGDTTTVSSVAPSSAHFTPARR